MAKFTVNKAHRVDPYKNFKFRVKFGTSPEYVVGISKVSALKRTTEMVEYREGGDPAAATKRRAARSTRRSPWSVA